MDIEQLRKLVTAWTEASLSEVIHPTYGPSIAQCLLLLMIYEKLESIDNSLIITLNRSGHETH